MNHYVFVFFVGLAGMGLLAGCQEEKQTDSATTAIAPHPALPADTGDAGEKLYGSVVETFDAGGFTYIQLDNGKERFWAAGPLTELAPGAMVAIFTGMPMENYHSKSLDRDFELIYFTERIITDARPEEDVTPPAELNPHADISRAAMKTPVAGIQKAEGGRTIQEIIDQKDALAGKPVRVRGKVVKFTHAVMGRNWIHIQDSSTGADLTVTTDGTAAIGDVIVAEGTLALDKDFGYGYVYDLILENAVIGKD